MTSAKRFLCLPESASMMNATVALDAATRTCAHAAHPTKQLLIMVSGGRGMRGGWGPYAKVGGVVDGGDHEAVQDLLVAVLLGAKDGRERPENAPDRLAQDLVVGRRAVEEELEQFRPGLCVTRCGRRGPCEHLGAVAGDEGTLAGERERRGG